MGTHNKYGKQIMLDISKILEKGSSLKRVSKPEALALANLTTVNQIHKLGQAGLKNRMNRFGRKASYVLNLAVNPSNICDSECGFCHYHASEHDPHSYVLTTEDILNQIKSFQPTEVHITGGLNKHWSYAKSLALITQIRSVHQKLYIKAYTAVEIDRFANDEKHSRLEILKELAAAGLNSLTGGGAEIFSERMRAKYCPTKIKPEAWLKTHHLAHGLGLSSNATMLYGLGETSEEIIDHLFALRDAQDKTGGFSCFIPLAYQPMKNNSSDYSSSPLENLKIIALSRLVLDNFNHIKAYWPMIGIETAAVGLSWGADDLDGTLGKERIAHAGDSRSPEALSRSMMIATIKSGGFIPHERRGDFT